MRNVVTLFIIPSLAFLLVSCGGGGGTNITSSGASNPGYGPFDRNGNYIEAWADKPAKKHRWARTGSSAPVREELPAVASRTVEKKAKKPTVARPTEVAKLTRPTTVTPPTPVPVRTYTPPPPPKPVVYTPPPTPKPKPAPKPKPVKPKAPPPIRHAVAKGDTLYSISRRYNTSVITIQRANGIKGSTIRLGQTLLIPRSL